MGSKFVVNINKSDGFFVELSEASVVVLDHNFIVDVQNSDTEAFAK